MLQMNNLKHEQNLYNAEKSAFFLIPGHYNCAWNIIIKIFIVFLH